MGSSCYSSNNSAPLITEKKTNDWEGCLVLSQMVLTTGSAPGSCLQDFSIQSCIGKGFFGKVFAAQSKIDKKLYAIKTIEKERITEEQQFDNLAAEREVLSTINHPFVAKMYSAFQTKDKLCFVMENLEGGELFYHLRRSSKFPEQTACFYAAQIVLAVDHLHSHNIMYRDLKPENILLDVDGNAVLTDFGLAKLNMSRYKKTKSFCGTPEYIAPEIITGKGYDRSADWWSLGILLYEMLSGKHPYKTRNNDKTSMYKKILEKPVKMRPEFSNEARSLINGLLAVKTHNRLGCSDLGADEIKCHEFFRSINWTMLEEKKIQTPISTSELSDDMRYDHLKTDNENQNFLLEDSITKESEKPEKMVKAATMSRNRAQTKANTNKEYRYFENFEYQRSLSTKTK